MSTGFTSENPACSDQIILRTRIGAPSAHVIGFEQQRRDTIASIMPNGNRGFRSPLRIR